MTPEEKKKEILKLFGEMCEAIPRKKIAEHLYHINEIELWICAVKELPPVRS